MAEMKKASERVFLVVVDDTEEMYAALRFACLRAKHTDGRVALLRVVEEADFHHWLGVSNIMKEEAREQAEQLLQRMATEVYEISGQMPELYVRDGDTRDQLLRLIDEERSISILVLAADTGPKGPGPLISALTGKDYRKLRIPVTIVPGSLTDEDIRNIA